MQIASHNFFDASGCHSMPAIRAMSTTSSNNDVAFIIEIVRK
jgi:hypothetical protein